MPNKIHKWSSGSSDTLKFTQWNSIENKESGRNEIIVYHSVTGDLHLVTQDGANILKILQGNKLSESELTNRFIRTKSPSLQVISSDDIARSILIPFQKLGLVELIE
jgi:hypothetical protein